MIIANTSNMPMMAREASIYTGVTVAEYFRDMGYDAVVIADSTSRWAEALREFASRSGALPAEEGYPAGLPSALAAFYERAGRVTTLGGRRGLGHHHRRGLAARAATSPSRSPRTPSASSGRCGRLDRDLAYARHYPAVAWAGSFSRDADGAGGLVRPPRRPGLGAPPRPGGWRCWPRPTGSATWPSSSGPARCPGTSGWCCSPAGCCARACCSRARCQPDDAYCSAAKTAALVDAVLAVVDALRRSWSAAGVPAAEVEEVDFAPGAAGAARRRRPDGRGRRPARRRERHARPALEGLR